MIRKRKKRWALFLSAVLIAAQLPAVAMAENKAPEATVQKDGSIASFEELPSGVKKQTVTVGTSLSELNLPDTVTATVYHVTEDTVIPDEDGSEDESGDSSTATPSDAKESVSENSSKDSSIKNSGETITTVTMSEEEIPVTWDSEPAYDGDTEGKYVFTGDAGGYTLSDNAKLPQIIVTVSSDTGENPTENPSTEPLPCTNTEGCTLEDGHESECVTAPPENDALVKTITGWTFVGDENLNGGELALPGVSMDNQADFDTVVSMLPTQISASIEGEAEPATLDITSWSCPEYIKDTDGYWPLTGDYTFTASLADGYTCAPAPTVRVPLGGATLYANNEYDGLTITATNGGSVSQATDKQITLNASGDYEISGTWNGTLDGVDRNNKKAVITVPDGVTANVTFSDLTINVGRTDGACAFAVAANGTANITLTSTNTLTSGDYCAGLEVPENATVTIDGNGSLEANGRYTGAGIGGGSSGSGGIIIINAGTVNATGGDGGAGIGGGGTTIIINAGTVNATGGDGGAGIGGGIETAGGGGTTITITGGTVNATGGSIGAGIGGGGNAAGVIGGSGGAIEITGGTVNATGGGNGAGIGGGSAGDGGDVAISGPDTKVTASGNNGGRDVGSGKSNSNGGSLSVTDGATLEMKNTGTNVTNPEYKNCTIIDKNGNRVKYDNEGKILPTLLLTAAPADFLALPGHVTLTATLSGAVSDNSGKTITFAVNSETYTKTTNSSGVATYTITNPSQGTYTFGASFEGDSLNNRVTAAEITGYTVIQEPDKPSGGGGGGGGTYTPPAPKDSYTVTGDSISQSVSRSDLKALADAGKSLTLRCDKTSMTFDPAALKAILAAVPASAGNITFAAAPADLSAYSDAATLVGSRPAYDFTLSYKDGKGNLVTAPVSFPAGSAAITLTYTRMAAETEGSLFMVYVDDKGAVIWLDKSSYDNGRVLAEVPHFSTYGVAYKTPAPVFTDISGHWAKQDIEFVAARGLLKGIGDSLSTGNNLFSPDSTMTRGMFVTALGRLAGVNPDNYKTCSFTDVNADAYYAAYVEWAAQKNIVKGTGDKLFSPDAPVTREQMAVIMVYYAGQMGYSIPTPLTSVNFADNDTISPRAAKEVAAMQRAGIVKGRDGNRFAPQENATRAEVSAVLRRFVEVVIDPATASGWTKNDSGHLLYYQSGKALTGWKEIGGKMYYFDENGIMAVNTKVDDYVRPE